MLHNVSVKFTSIFTQILPFILHLIHSVCHVVIQSFCCAVVVVVVVVLSDSNTEGSFPYAFWFGNVYRILGMPEYREWC